MAIYPNGKIPIVSHRQEISQELFNEFSKAKVPDPIGRWYTIKSPARCGSDTDDNPSLGILIKNEIDKEGVPKYYLTIKDHSGKNTNEEIFDSFEVEWIAKRTSYWDYTKSDGSYAYSKVKIEVFKKQLHTRDKKYYFCAIRTGDKFDSTEAIKKAGGHLLYNLPSVINGKGDLFIFEGEKDFDTGIELLKVANATTTDNGAKSWRKEFVENIKHYDRIIIVPHNDEAGRDYLNAVAYSLVSVGYTEVYVLNLEGVKEKGDITDWIEMGHTKDEFDHLLAHTLVQVNPDDVKPVSYHSTIKPSGPKFWLAPIDNFRSYIAVCKEISSMTFRVKHGDWYQVRLAIREIPKVPNSIYEVKECYVSNLKKLEEYLGTGYNYTLMTTITKEDGSQEVVSPRPYKVNIVRFMTDYVESAPYTIPEVHEVVFRPAKPMGVYNENGYALYNAYTGLAIQPVKGDTSEFWDHIRKNITTNSDSSTNEEDYLVLRTWFAKKVQDPENPPLIFITLLADRQGAGRGTVMSPLMAIFNGYVANVDWADIVGDKNGVIKNKLIFRVEDKPKPSDDVVEAIKSLITTHTQRLRELFRDTTSTVSYGSVLVETNDPSKVIIETSNRRNYIIHTQWTNPSNDYRQECARKYIKFMTVEYLSAILWDLIYDTPLHEPGDPNKEFDFVGRTQLQSTSDNRSMAVRKDGLIQYLRWVRDHCQFDYHPQHRFNYDGVNVSIKNGELNIDDIYQISWSRNKRFGKASTLLLGYASYCTHNRLPQIYYDPKLFIGKIKEELKKVEFELKPATRSKSNTYYNWPESYSEFAKLIDKISGEEFEDEDKSDLELMISSLTSEE